MLVAGEVAVRALAGYLPAPLPAWGSWEAQKKADAIGELGGKGGANVLLLGSSMMTAAVDPAQLTELLGDERPAFDGSLLGGTARLFDWWATKVAVERLRPHTVVIGVASRDLNDGSGSPAYDTITSSPAAKIVNGKDGFADRLEQRAADWSYLVRYRTQIRRPYAWLKEEPSVVGERVDVTPLGSISNWIIQDTYQVREAFRRQGAERAYRDYSIGGLELASLGHLVDNLTARGIEVVIVTMPVTEDAIALHPRGALDQARFVETLSTFVASRGVRYLDMDAAFPGTVGFADPHHLASSGRRRFTALLAEFLQ